MSRYIDAEWLKEHIEVISYEGMWHTTETDEFVAVDNINQAPSIDIVRCGECRRVREDGGHANCNGYLYCRKWKTLVDEDGYCSWGEREGE